MRGGAGNCGKHEAGAGRTRDGAGNPVGRAATSAPQTDSFKDRPTDLRLSLFGGAMGVCKLRFLRVAAALWTTAAAGLLVASNVGCQQTPTVSHRRLIAHVAM